MFSSKIIYIWRVVVLPNVKLFLRRVLTSLMSTFKNMVIRIIT